MTCSRVNCTFLLHIIKAHNRKQPVLCCVSEGGRKARFFLIKQTKSCKIARGRHFISTVTDHHCGKYAIMIAGKRSLETDGSLHTQTVTANVWGFLVTRIYKPVSWLRRLVAGFSPLMTSFSLRTVCRICDGRNGTGTCFSPGTSISLCQHRPPVLHPHSFLNHGRYTSSAIDSVIKHHT